MPASWNGFHYDGRTAHREAVTVSVTAAGLYLERADGGAILWPFGELRRAAGVPADHLRLERASDPPEALLVHGTDLVAAIAEISPADAALLHVARRAGMPSARAMQWAAAGTAALVAGYFWGLPVFARWAAQRVPATWEEQLGQAAIDRLAPPARRCTDPTQAAALQRILERLRGASAAPGAQFSITVTDDSVVNAFAAPGGRLVFNRGLLHAARTPEEVAGVMAHEMQHVLHHHPTQALVRQIPLQIAIASLSGGNEGLATAARAAGTLGALRYYRGDEIEADSAGMRLIQAARVDPRGMVDFMSGLGRRSAGAPMVASYLSTHPNTGDRVARLEALAAEAHYPPLPLLPPDEWSRVKDACRGAAAP